jgi:hypothetical protein
MPEGVELFSLTADGGATRAGGAAVRDGFLPFIDDGQLARYFIGDRFTSPARPSNATYKMGLIRPHSSFTPHAHGGGHVVLSLGYATCGLYDADRDACLHLAMPPGTLVRIPAMLPHAFGNRSGRPLVILAANTGYGVDHEDYATTADVAERRAAAEAGLDWPALAKALRALESSPALDGLTWSERVAAVLRRLATRLEER